MSVEKLQTIRRQLLQPFGYPAVPHEQCFHIFVFSQLDKEIIDEALNINEDVIDCKLRALGKSEEL